MSKIIAWTLVLALAAPTLADEKKFDAETRAKAIAPYLDEQTIAVGHVDLTRVDADAIAAKVIEYAKLKEEDIAGPKKEVGDWLAAWTKAGVREIYVVVSLADIPGLPPFVVVPLEGDVDAKNLSDALGRAKPFQAYQFEKIGSAMVGGAERTVT